MNDLVGAHNELHSEQGARKGEHCGRSRNPVIKVADIAWLEFEKPDLQRAEAFAAAFGFATSLRTDEELHLRGSDSTAPCVIVRRGTRSRFLGVAFAAADEADLLRLATATGARTRPLPAAIGGMAVDLIDPSGVPVHVVSGMHSLDPLPSQTPHRYNMGHEIHRINVTQRPRREPTTVQRLPELRASGAGVLLLWEMIRYSGEVLQLPIFDFLGSMIQPIERVRRQFGAVQQPYFRLRRERSALLRLGKSVLRS